MNHLADEIEDAARRWRSLDRPPVDVAVVAGSGLAVDLGTPVTDSDRLSDWLPFPVRSIAGHDHRIELLRPRAGRHALYFRGRIHAYQGYDAAQVVFGIRLAARLGARTLILTNASGGIRPEWGAGTLAAISDHLNLSGRNPLHGEPPEAWGPRFPDMVGAYDAGLRRLAQDLAAEEGFQLEEGVYAGLAGPSYETPAEIRMLRTLGADLAGMSTVLEIIAARHLGLRCLAVSLVSNPAAGVGAEALDHADVLEVGRQAAGRVGGLLRSLLEADELD